MCSSPIGSCSDPKCDAELPELDQNDLSDGENSNACDEHYDDFLREMAGSFENCEDDESDVGSGSEKPSDEDDGTQAAGLKCSSVDEYDAYLREMAGSFENYEDDECDAGSQGQESTKESKGQSMDFMDSMNSVEPSKFSFDPRAHYLQSSDKGPTQSTTAHPPRSSFPPHTPVSKGRFVVTLLHPDQREPVSDDYDVAKATAEYAAQQPPRCCQNEKQQQQRLRCCQIDEQREDLEDAIKLQTDQAAKLFGQEGKPQLPLHLRSHYAHVRSELLAEVCTMKKQLQVLVEAQQQPTQEQRQGRLEARQQPTQKNNCSKGHRTCQG